MDKPDEDRKVSAAAKDERTERRPRGHMTFPPPGPLITTGNLAQHWRDWRQIWNAYEVVAGLTEETSEYRIATFVTCIGQDALKIYNPLPFQRPQDKMNMTIVLDLMERHCIGESNVIYDRFRFNRRDQEEHEGFEEYMTALQELVQKCSFGTMEDELLRDRIVCGIRDGALRRQLLQRKALTLPQCRYMCRASEATAKQVKIMEKEDKIHAVQQKTVTTASRFKTAKSSSGSTANCVYCGFGHKKGRSNCQAFGKTCMECGKMNHFAQVCRQKGQKPVKSRVQQFQDENNTTDSSDEDPLVMTVTLSPDQESVNAVSGPSGQFQRQIFATLLVHKKPVRFQLDTGATCNVICKSDVPDGVTIEPTRQVLSMYSNDKIKPVGKCRLVVRNPKTSRRYIGEFVVIQEGFTAILGAKSVQAMGMITVEYEKIQAVTKQQPTTTTTTTVVDSDTPTEKEAIFATYPAVFEGEVGLFPGQLHLELDPAARGVQLPLRKVPIAMKPLLQEELQRLAHLDVIKKIEKPTDWVSHIVLVKKANGKIRVCLDPKPLNQALKRPRYPVPTLDDILPELARARVFSIADVRNGFWHIAFDDESSELTTFSTPFGCYRWKRWPFGVSPAPEVFQMKLHQLLEGLPGVFAIADDILITGEGSSEVEATADHDRKLHAFLQRCQQNGIKLNKEKFRHRLTSVSYMGHLLTADGLKPDRQKVQAILDMPKPTDVSGIRRVLGVVNYLSRFTENLADLCRPLRQLTDKDNAWEWTHEHDIAFTKLKEAMSAIPVLRYFDPTVPITLQCDASSTVLGAVLLQQDQPVAYASRALTATEVNYAQIEKELLAILFGLERFHHYTYGVPVTVQSDHQPLQTISRKPLHTAPKRLQRMLLRLQRYLVTINYRQGKHMHIADTLSRAYLQDTSEQDEPLEVLQFREELQASDMRQALDISETAKLEIQRETAGDRNLQDLMLVVQQGCTDSKDILPDTVRPYFAIRDEIAVHEGLVFRGNRVIIPQGMRRKTLHKIHRSHIGVNGCIRRARDSLYWPRMAADIKTFVSQCETCRSLEQKQPKETLICHEYPTRPWAKVASDLCSLDGRDYLITVDYFSNFAEVDKVTDATSGGIIELLKQQFAPHGIPDTIMTDNGPQFASTTFRAFTNDWQFRHITSSPAYPQSNGKVENAIKTVKRLFKRALRAGDDPWLVLLAFRNTPTENLQTSPNQRLFCRRTKTQLPIVEQLLQPAVIHDQAKGIKQSKEKQTEAYNKAARDLPVLTAGQTVRMQPREGKTEWKKAKVTRVLPYRSYEVVASDGRTYRRNRRHLRSSQEPGPQFLKEAPPTDCDIPPCEDRSSKVRSREHRQQSLGSSSPAELKEPLPPELPGTSPTANGQQPAQTITRSGRTVKSPSYLQDYVW